MRRRIPSTFALVAFEAAARRLSFTQAAKELHVTQSAVSHQVIALEKSLGAALFKRIRQRLELTDAGRRLLEGVAPALHTIESVLAEIGPGLAGGAQLKIGAVPPYATKWLIPRLPELSREHPEITINLVSRLERFDFADTDLDAAIHYGRPDWPGARCEYLLGEEMVVVCGAALRERLARPEDLRAVTLLHQSTRPNAWRNWARAAGIVLDTAAGPRFDLFSMTAQATVSGLGAAVLPRFLIVNELAAGQLIVPFGPTLQDELACYFVYPERSMEVPAVKALHDWLMQEAGRLAHAALPADDDAPARASGAATRTAPAASR